MAPYIRLLALFLFLVALPRAARGQFSIHSDPGEIQPLELRVESDDPLPKIVRQSYTTYAMMRAEKRRLRRERNTFSTTVETKINQSLFGNWAKGGDNTFSGSVNFKANHTYKKERLSFITDFNTKLGINVIDTVLFKNEDSFELKHQTAWGISEFWSLSGNIKLSSQYMKGYKSKSDNTLVSDFMSPGTLELSPGFSYKPQYWNVTISPVKGKMTFVLSDSLSRKGINGVEKGKHFKPSLGSSLDVTFKRKFSKDRFEYETELNAFWNYTLDPTVSWENTLRLFTTKWLTTSFFWHMIYDREANVPRKEEGKFLQWNSNVGLTAVFTFKSKR